MKQLPTCDLCNDPLNPARGSHTFQTDIAELTIHKECALQLMVGVWDEMESRHARGELYAEPLAPPQEAPAPVQKGVQEATGTSYLDELLASAAYKADPLTSKRSKLATKLSPGGSHSEGSFPATLLAWSMNDEGEWEQTPIPTFVQKSRLPQTQELIWKHTQTAESETEE
ncbi:hypothetical protein [Ktedonobacter racemifer]|uniref:Uncharacterized protein n=1 Tax=Ktedonobacter racemifer DSM 44963 TaxID=485913 RepID=D6U551_KTERA|nr:hypothetical protein [Ktedonobacter racemifer]EFH81631.1 hypothetical protein Krac_2367 [Ktedonobacter racemifer DSM 44963]